jgi:hypothetical protein
MNGGAQTGKERVKGGTEIFHVEFSTPGIIGKKLIGKIAETFRGGFAGKMGTAPAAKTHIAAVAVRNYRDGTPVIAVMERKIFTGPPVLFMPFSLSRGREGEGRFPVRHLPLLLAGNVRFYFLNLFNHFRLLLGYGKGVN